MTAYFVNVRLKTAYGELSTPMGWTERPEVAEARAAEMRGSLGNLLNEQVGEHGPPLKVILSRLGIVGFSIDAWSVEVEGQILTPPEAGKIIL